MRTQARAVVIGGGVAGASILYHLARLGWRDVVLVEQFQLTHGSTWHSAGLVGQLRSTLSLTRMMQYSVGLYAELARETGKDPGWHELGGLRLACTPARDEEIRRQAAWAKTFGLALEIVSPREAQELFPLMSTEGVLAAAFLPQDGYLDPSQLTFALADGARRLGAELETRTRVTGIRLENGRVEAVETDKGTIQTDVVVARVRHLHAGRRAAGGRRRADHPVRPPVPRHRAVRPAAGGAADAARPRRPVYCAPRSAGWSWAATSATRRRGRSTACPRLRGRAAARGLGPLRGASENAIRRVPAMETAQVKRFFNGPEAFTPDGEFCLGESAVPGFWVAAGFCAHGLAGAGGVGKVMAEWIVDGQPEYDVWHMDLKRFGRHYRSQRYTLARTYEGTVQYYDIKYPAEERRRAAAARLPRLPAACRPGRRLRREGRLGARQLVRQQRRRRRRGPAAARLGRAGPGRPRSAPRPSPRGGPPGIFDQSSFFQARGARPRRDGVPGAARRQRRRPAGRLIVYTQLLNPRGGIECDFSVTRLGPRPLRSSPAPPSATTTAPGSSATCRPTAPSTCAT